MRSRQIVQALAALTTGVAVLVGVPRPATAGGGRGNIDPGLIEQFQENMDPEMMQSIEQLGQVIVQAMSNMQQAGVDPAQYFQQMQRTDDSGAEDIDAVVDDMVEKGYMTQEMLATMQTVLGNMAGSMQRSMVNTTYARIRQLLSPSDQEWTILQPKVKRVLDAQVEVAQGGETVNNGNSVLGVGGNMGLAAIGMGTAPGRGSRSGLNDIMAKMGGPPGSDSELGKAWKALQTALEDKKMAEVTLKGKLDAWRGLHERARAELRAAQADLLSVLTLRQEAVMIMVGVL